MSNILSIFEEPMPSGFKAPEYKNPIDPPVKGMADYIEFSNDAKIIYLPTNSGKPRGFEINFIFWPDMEIVDAPPEISQLIDENINDLLLK